MAKLHTHYIINAQKELKYAYADVSEDDLQFSVRTALNRSDNFDEDERDNFLMMMMMMMTMVVMTVKWVIMIQIIKKLQKSKNGLI